MSTKKGNSTGAATATATARGDLTDRAMLIGLTIHQWVPWKTDEKVTDEVANSHQVHRDVGRYRKRLVKSDDLVKVITTVNKLRKQHAFMTLPWSDESGRILSSAGYFKYKTEMDKLISEFNDAAENFAVDYPAYVKDAQVRLGNMFDPADYPKSTEIRDRFRVDMPINPLPAGADFRVDLGNVETAKIRKQIEADVKDTVAKAIKDVWVRIHDVLERASARLKEYNVTADGKVEHAFRDSLIGNINELLDVVPFLNITGDPKLTQFADDIRKEVASVQPQVLRDDNKVRAEVVNRADEILAKMQAFIA